MREDEAGIRVKGVAYGVEFEAQGGKKAMGSLDQLASSLIDIAAFIPRTGANIANHLLAKQEMRLQSVTDLARPHIEVIPEEVRQEPSDKIKRAIVTGVEVEDDPDIQEVWARFLARSVDGRHEEPALLLAATIEKMTKKDLDFFQRIHQELNAQKIDVIENWQETLAEVHALDNPTGIDVESDMEALKDILPLIGRVLVERAPEVITRNAKDHLLSLGIIAPRSKIDATSLHQFGFELSQAEKDRNRGLYLDGAREATLQNLNEYVRSLSNAVERAFEEMESSSFRLTNVGGQLYEIAIGEPLSKVLSVTEGELLDKV